MPLFLSGYRHRIWNDSCGLLLADLQHGDRWYQKLCHVAEHVAVEREIVWRDVQVALQQNVAYQRATVVV